MRPTKQPPGEKKPEPIPGEEEMAVIRFLFTLNPTRDESRLAVRRLLREASRSLEPRE